MCGIRTHTNHNFHFCSVAAENADWPAVNVETSTLSNGLRVVSSKVAGQAASVGLFVNAGSSFESGVTRGATQTLERFAFGTTDDRTDLRIFRDLEDAGVSVDVSSDREQVRMFPRLILLLS